MRLTIPNILTFFRLLAAPCVALLLIFDFGDFGASLALIVFLLASITDYLDGYLARVLNQVTALGKILDPIADKAMVIIVLCFLSFEVDGQLNRVLFGIPTVCIIFREIFISGVREYIGSTSDLLAVTKLSKWKTAMQMFAIGLLLAGNIEFLKFLPITLLGLVVLWVAGIITILTGVDYFKKVLINLERE
jgi:cardiolipin synthase